MGYCFLEELKKIGLTSCFEQNSQHYSKYDNSGKTFSISLLKGLMAALQGSLF